VRVFICFKKRLLFVIYYYSVFHNQIMADGYFCVVLKELLFLVPDK